MAGRGPERGPHDDEDAAEQRRRRRAVLNDVRRTLERQARVAAAAEALAVATERVLRGIDARPPEVDAEAVSALRAALARYRDASG